MIAVPVRVSPVKVMAVDAGVAGQVFAGRVRPEAVHHVVHALGNAGWFITSPSSAAVCGVSSEGLTTTVLPQANAGPTFQVISNSGRFHGAITAITPRGRRRP